MRLATVAMMIVSMSLVAQADVPDTGEPHVFLADAEQLMEVRARVAAGDPALQPAMDKLLADAKEALEAGPFTVVEKPMTPPSGDKHDYMSVGPYWWPNPDTEDGLPYVRRDGDVNPERYEYDNVRQSKMSSAVRTLALAYFLTGEKRYATHAARLLRVWYLDEETRMNPHLEYGQAIPGRVDGRGIGIIDTLGLPLVLDAVGMLQASAAWTDEDQRGLQQWFSDYLDWIWTHPYGKAERNTRNNHGTWYDVQAVAYALFTERDEKAREVLESVPENRIAKHFEPDGRQPHELARTKSFAYSTMNLRGFFYLATMGAQFDSIDLWRFETEDGRSLRQGLDWILKHAFGDGEWEFENMTPITPGRMLPLLRMAAVAYGESAYEEKLHELAGEDWAADRWNLLHPAQ
ncbi:MAG: alginate lyase family protein [Candidatus Hydrogenedentota bacterium]